MKPLTPIVVGETVRMQRPGEKTWSTGTSTGLAGTRSYDIEVNGRHYWRNRYHLLQTKEAEQPDPPNDHPMGDNSAGTQEHSESEKTPTEGTGNSQ